MACVSVNWKWPAEISVGAPSTDQLLSEREILLDATTVKASPGILAKPNWKEPFPSLVVLPSTMEGMSTRTMPEVLGMPFTYTVAMAYPIGKPFTGAEVNVLLDQFRHDRKSD